MKYSLSTREIQRAEPKGFPEGSGYISPYIPPLIIIHIQYAVWSSKKQYGAVRSSTEHYGAVRSSMEQYVELQNSTEQYGAVQSIME